MLSPYCELLARIGPNRVTVPLPALPNISGVTQVLVVLLFFGFLINFIFVPFVVFLVLGPPVSSVVQTRVLFPPSVASLIAVEAIQLHQVGVSKFANTFCVCEKLDARDALATKAF